MNVITSQYEALTRDRLALMRMREYSAQQERRITQLTQGLEAEREARKESYRGKLELLARVREAETRAGEAEEVARFWYKAWGQVLEWWMACRQHLKRYRERQEWEEQLFANDLGANDKIYQWAVSPLTRQGWRQTDASGRAWLTRDEMKARTNQSPEIQRDCEKRLIKSGIADVKTYTDKATLKSRVYVGFTDLLERPAEQQRPADTPRPGGNRRPPCDTCGGTDFKAESRTQHRYTCTQCGTVSMDESPWRLLDAGGNPTITPELTITDDDFWTRASDSLAEMPGERIVKQEMGHLFTVPNRAPQTRQVPPCSVCGGTIERLKLGQWICVTCHLNQYQKGA